MLWLLQAFITTFHSELGSVLGFEPLLNVNKKTMTCSKSCEQVTSISERKSCNFPLFPPHVWGKKKKCVCGSGESQHVSFYFHREGCSSKWRGGAEGWRLINRPKCDRQRCLGTNDAGGIVQCCAISEKTVYNSSTKCDRSLPLAILIMANSAAFLCNWIKYNNLVLHWSLKYHPLPNILVLGTIAIEWRVWSQMGHWWLFASV